MIQGSKVVLVDDEKEILESFADILFQSDIDTVKFCDPNEALAYILKNHAQIAMIISDLKMPEMTGFELKSKINGIADEIPFCIVTGYWDRALSEQSLELGVKAFLEKPLKSADFIEQLVVKYAVPRAESLIEEREMVEGFLEESFPMLEEIEGLILELEEDPNNQESLAVYFRLLHTIKGTASCVGLSQLGEFTHHYEDFIGELRNGVIQVSTKSINVLLAGLDRLKVFFEMCSLSYTDSEIDVNLEISIFSQFRKDKTGEVNDVVDKVDFENVNKALEVKADKGKEKKKEAEKISVGMDLLDSFMEENGELTVIRNSIIKTVKRIETRLRGDSELEVLNDLLQGMYDITSNIQNKITEMREVPLKNVFRPFKRLVRDICKTLDKEVELVINGDELYVDNVIAKLYSNTLIHLIRNSLDHGIEKPEDRVFSGKSASGTLIINVEQRGELINLEIIDDGKGIDPSFIANKALEKEIFTQDEINRMSKSEVLSIIFHSGFSTAQVVSDLSGRGVGMDMVRASFEDLGGQIKIDSDIGKGTTFNLVVPVPKSVLIINSLQVKSGNQLFLFSMDEVVEVLKVTSNSSKTQINIINGTHFLRHNNHFYELCHLQSLVANDGSTWNDTKDLNIVILKHKAKFFGVVVDQIFEFEEVVMRKISNQIEHSSLYQGAALLGSGEVSLIFSAHGIMDHIGIKQQVRRSASVDESNSKAIENLNEYIIFEDNRHEQLCIDLKSVYRFEKINVEKITSTGDNHLVNYFGEALPLIDPYFVVNLHENSEIFQSKDSSLDVIVLNVDERKVGIVVGKIGDLSSTTQSPDPSTIDVEGLEGSIYINEKTICVLDPYFVVSKTNWSRPRRDESEDGSLVFDFPEAA